jgi:hypothetical protein
MASMSQGLAVLNPAGCVRYCGGRAGVLLGIEPSDVRGKLF